MPENILNKPFGMNIFIPERTAQQYKQTLNKAVSSLWTPLFDYFEKNENVFSGDISKEIAKYNAITYSMGSIARGGADIPKLDAQM